MQKPIQIQGKERSVSKFMLRILKWSGFGFVILLLIGFAYQQIATAIEVDNYPPVGELVDIGDYQLHLVATGDADGLPTVVFESGMGTPSAAKDWEVLQAELAKYTRVISYDRAGYGWSDLAHNDRTAEQIADDLHKLLEVTGEEGPFLLVGHSFGGFSAQIFADKYKEDVAGIVLVDSSNVNMEGGFSKAELYIFRFLKEVGVGRVLEEIDMLPLHEHFLQDKASIAMFYQDYYNADQMSELTFMMTTSVEQVKNAQKDGFGDLPLSVLYVDYEDYPEWKNMQKEVASLSNNGKEMLVEDADHFIHLDKPDVVIDVIMEMLSSFKE